MAKTLENEVDIQAPLQTVSIAMNGLLNLDDDLRRVRNTYSFDVRKDKMLKRSPERSYLQRLYSLITRGEFRLEERPDGSTGLHYTLTRTNHARMLVIVLLVELLFFIACGIMLGRITDSILPLLLFLAFFAFIALICGLSIFFSYSSRAVEKRFHQDFLPRLDAYIEIVKKKERERAAG